jgi:hypothetical protein
MKVIDISSRIFREKSEPDGVSDGVSAVVIEFGLCSGCQKPLRLVDHACKKCRGQFGEKCGLLFQRFREDKKLAAGFYKALTPGRQRVFIRLFGLPDGCLEPAETLPRGSHPHLRVVCSIPTQSPRDPNF